MPTKTVKPKTAKPTSTKTTAKTAKPKTVKRLTETLKRAAAVKSESRVSVPQIKSVIVGGDVSFSDHDLRRKGLERVGWMYYNPSFSCTRSVLDSRIEMYTVLVRLEMRNITPLYAPCVFPEKSEV